jgi:hypothetical protein
VSWCLESWRTGDLNLGVPWHKEKKQKKNKHNPSKKGKTQNPKECKISSLYIRLIKKSING